MFAMTVLQYVRVRRSREKSSIQSVYTGLMQWLPCDMLGGSTHTTFIHCLLGATKLGARDLTAPSLRRLTWVVARG